MRNNKIVIVKKLFRSPNILIFAVGIILIMFGVWVGRMTQTWGAILLSIGTALVSTSLTFLINYLSEYKEDMYKENVKKWGLCGIYKTRAEINDTSNNLLRKAKELDICAMGLKSFRDAQSDLIRARVKKGMKIRILTISPDSAYAKDIDENEGLLIGSTKTAVEDLQAWLGSMKKYQKNPDQIQIRTYDHYPFEFYFRIDNVVFCGPYQTKTSQQTITLYFEKGGEGYNYYRNYFENLWGKYE